MNATSAHTAPARNIARRNTALLLRGRYNAWRWTFAVFAGLVLAMLALGTSPAAMVALAGIGTIAVSHAAADLLARAAPVCTTLPVPRARVCTAAWRRGVLWFPLLTAAAVAVAVAMGRELTEQLFTLGMSAYWVAWAAGLQALFALTPDALRRSGEQSRALFGGDLYWFVMCIQFYTLPLILFSTPLSDRLQRDWEGPLLAVAAGLLVLSWAVRRRILFATKPTRAVRLGAPGTRAASERPSRWAWLEGPPMMYAVGAAGICCGIAMIGEVPPAVWSYGTGLLVVVGILVMLGRLDARTRLVRTLPQSRRQFVTGRLAAAVAGSAGAFLLVWLVSALLFGMANASTRLVLLLWGLGAPAVILYGVLLRRYKFTVAGWLVTALVNIVLVFTVLVNIHRAAHGGDATPWPVPAVMSLSLLAALGLYALAALALHRALRDPNFYRNHGERV